MRRGPLDRSILRSAVVMLAGALLITGSACKKKLPPAPPPALEEQAPAPTPELPQTKVEEEAIQPPRDAKETSEDLDDIIRRQNASRELLKTVYFEFDKADIRDDQVPVLQANAAWLKAHSQYRILVEGHCDERDTIEYNLALGDRRARGVRQYLIDLGVGADRIRTISYGEERPADPGHDEDAWGRNRRAEFTLEK